MKSSIIFCLFLLSSFAFSQSYTSYFIGNTTNSTTSPSGGVCLMGGASEDDEAMKWFLQRANGGDVLVLRTSGADGYNSYMYTDLGVPVNSVETIVFNNASASNEAYIHQKIMNAEAIWFAGGDQWNYISYWRETPIQNLINDALQNRNIVIGGTSAGMAIQGSHYFSAQYGTVTSTTALNNPYDTNVTVANETFITNTHLTNTITDTHYDDPDRRGRHAVFLARMVTDQGIMARGIACDEYTAVCVDTNGIASVFGEHPTYDDNAYFLQVNCENMPNLPENCTNGQPLNWNLNGDAVKVYKVKGTTSGSNTFDLNDWETGSGGSWENWSVNNGTLNMVSGNPIDFTNCIPVNTNEVERLSISIFPNPVQDNFFHIQTSSTIDYISILNTSGQVVKTINGSVSTNQAIDVSTLANGIYFIKLQADNVNHFEKLVLQR